LPRTLKIDFYKTVDADGEALDVSDLIVRASQLPFATRRVDLEDSFVCLHNVRRRDGNILGEILKARMTDLPDKVSRNTGLPEDLGLAAHEGIGRRAHFYYDRANRALVFQRDREIRSGAFVTSVATPVDSAFGLSLIFKRDALARLDRMQVLRKVAFTVASPAAAAVIREVDPSAARAIDLLGEVGGRQMEINISVGKARHVGLERNRVMEMVRWLVGHRGEEVRRVIISGREQPDAATAVIDLLEDRLVHEVRFEEGFRRIAQETIEAALLAAHADKADYLRMYGNEE
jgi:Family of unknown function (DUF6731)